MKQGFIIPVYRHGNTAGPLAQKLAASRFFLEGGCPSGESLPVIMVDDGNDAETKKCLEEWRAKTQGIVLVRLEKNLGKGGAVIKGIEKAAELGLTHVLQIDADGQHDTGQASFFLNESVKHPDKVICGLQEYDASVPGGRLSGRKISNFWAAITSLSLELKDVLCGFRVYPVEEVLRITGNSFLDSRMGFDPEILIRLYWNKVYPVYYPVKVIYPENGISNFHNFRDNARISGMFMRLFFGMLLRLPMLVFITIKRRNLPTGNTI